ncbi:MAG: hypothetical protein ACFFCQ_00525 [Promethearchaeota archaeon]
MKIKATIVILIAAILLQSYSTPKIIQCQSVTYEDETIAQCKVFQADDPLETNLLQYEEKWVSDVPNRAADLYGFFNNTELIFEATLINPLKKTITLKEFRVHFFAINGTPLFPGENNTFESPVIKVYSQKDAEKTMIKGSSTKTERIQVELGLPYYKQEAPPEEVGQLEQQVEISEKNKTAAYLTQFNFEYDEGLTSSVNFTLLMLPPPSKKPIFLLYLIGGLTLIVIGMMMLAVYGRITGRRKEFS